MKFSKVVVITATIMLATSTWAQNEAQAPVETPSTPGGVVILNTNSNTNGNTSASTATNSASAVAQPTTVVEAAPLADGKAEALRKARQNAEVQTEQKIVEKLEDSRLNDEQRRAERLFGDRLNSNEGMNVNNNSATATVVAPVVQPVATPATEIKEEKPAPTVVNIEKVEIVQPAPVVAPVVTEPTPITPIVDDAKGESKIDHPIAVAHELKERWYVGGGVGSSNYNANNVDSSYSIGVTVGKNMAGRWNLEGLFNYSTHNIDTYWQGTLYREMEQYDFGGAAKYYLMNDMWKPYVGGQLIYSYRKYKDRNLDNCGWSCDPTLDEESTHALDLGPGIGLDVAVNRQFMVGVDYKYNFNFVNKRDINYAKYGVPAGTKPLEEISFYTLQITAKYLF